MAFEFQIDRDKFESEGREMPSRFLESADLDYIKARYGKETASICECIFKGDKPSIFGMDCICSYAGGWIVDECLQDIELQDGEEYASLAIWVFCADCKSNNYMIDGIRVKNADYDESKYFRI